MPELANIGIAGLLFNNENKVVNAPHWPMVKGNELAKEFNMKKFQLYNDLEIQSYSIFKLKKEDLVQINDAE